jgi:hypothetical protein
MRNATCRDLDTEASVTLGRQLTQIRHRESGNGRRSGRDVCLSLTAGQHRYSAYRDGVGFLNQIDAAVPRGGRRTHGV